MPSRLQNPGGLDDKENMIPCAPPNTPRKGKHANKPLNFFDYETNDTALHAWMLEQALLRREGLLLERSPSSSLVGAASTPDNRKHEYVMKDSSIHNILTHVADVFEPMRADGIDVESAWNSPRKDSSTLVTIGLDHNISYRFYGPKDTPPRKDNTQENDNPFLVEPKSKPVPFGIPTIIQPKTNAQPVPTRPIQRKGTAPRQGVAPRIYDFRQRGRLSPPTKPLSAVDPNGDKARLVNNGSEAATAASDPWGAPCPGCPDNCPFPAICQAIVKGMESRREILALLDELIELKTKWGIDMLKPEAMAGAMSILGLCGAKKLIPERSNADVMALVKELPKALEHFNYPSFSTVLNSSDTNVPSPEAARMTSVDNKPATPGFAYPLRQPRPGFADRKGFNSGA